MQYFTINFLVILSGMYIDLITPILPSIQSYFMISTFKAQWLLSTGFISQGICALIAGNLSDKYGYKPVLMTGISIFLLGTVMSLAVENFNLLLICRLLQGIGISAPTILSYKILVTIFSKNDQTQKFATTSGVSLIAMSLSPIISSHINHYYTWRGNFFLLAIFAAIALIICHIFIKNSDVNHDIKLSLKEYAPLIKSKKVLIAASGSCLFLLSVASFSTLSPNLFINIYKIDPKIFGYYPSLIITVSAILGLVSGTLIKKYGEKKLTYISMLCVIINVIFNIIIILFGIENPNIVTFTALFLAAGIIIPSNMLYAYLLGIDEEATGRLAALYSVIKSLFNVIIIQSVSYFMHESYLPLGVAIIITALVSVIITIYIMKTSTDK